MPVSEWMPLEEAALHVMQVDGCEYGEAIRKITQECDEGRVPWRPSGTVWRGSFGAYDQGEVWRADILRIWRLSALGRASTPAEKLRMIAAGQQFARGPDNVGRKTTPQSIKSVPGEEVGAENTNEPIGDNAIQSRPPADTRKLGGRIEVISEAELIALVKRSRACSDEEAMARIAQAARDDSTWWVRGGSKLWAPRMGTLYFKDKALERLRLATEKVPPSSSDESAPPVQRPAATSPSTAEPAAAEDVADAAPEPKGRPATFEPEPPKIETRKRRGAYKGPLVEWTAPKPLQLLERMGPSAIAADFRAHCEIERPDLLPLLPNRPRSMEPVIERIIEGRRQALAGKAASKQQ
jgi:hypothetical protein